MKGTKNRKLAKAASRLAMLFLYASALSAQATSAAPATHTSDIALSFTAENANPVGGGGNFWLEGGSAEMGVTLWRGFAIAGNFTGTHTSSAGAQNVPLGLLVYTFGPRYRWNLSSHISPKAAPASVYGEALVGGVKGFDSLFPAGTGATSTANSFALQLGFGVDLKLKNHFGLRPLEFSWVRMQLPNSTTNVQNDLRISTGVVFSY